MKTFTEEWQKFYSDRLPLPHELRVAARENWIRFHYLPFSQRYAQTKPERDTVLQRLETLGNLVLGQGQECWLVRCIPHYPGETELGGHMTVRYSDISLAHLRSITDGEEADVIWHVYAAACSWERHAFNRMLLAIADDDRAFSGSTFWMSSNDGAVYAPYDGGIDLFHPSVQKVETWRNRFFKWLSDEPSGL